MLSTKNNINELFRKIDVKKAVAFKAMGDGMVKGMREFEAFIIKTQLSGRPGLVPHSGAAGIRGSFFLYQKGRELNKVVTLASRSKYIGIHQHGGTIRPKKAKALTIPISPKSKGKFARDFGKLAIVQHEGNAFLMQPKTGEFLFVLKKSVTIPKRLHITEAYNSTGRKMIKNQMIMEIKRRIRQTGKK